MTAKLLRDLPRPLAVPAAYNQFGVEDPVGRRMRTLGQLAHLALLGGVERRTGRNMFGHGEPPWPPVHADFTPLLRNDAYETSAGMLGRAEHTLHARPNGLTGERRKTPHVATLIRAARSRCA